MKYENLADSFSSFDTPWQDKTGMAVEDFITRKLAASEVVGMDYVNSELILKKADGSVVKLTITVEEPTYDYGVFIYGLRITDAQGKNSNIYVASDATLVDQYLVGKKYELGLAIYATSSTSISTSDKVGTVSTKIEFGSKSKTFNVTNIDYTLFEKDGEGNVTGLKISDTTQLVSTISWIDITELFTKSQSSSKITATIQEKDAPVKRSFTLNRNITVEVLELSYLGNYINSGNSIYFLVKGGSGVYKLLVFNNKVRDDNNVNGLTYTGLKSGLNQLIVRAINEVDSNIYTSWMYLNIINTQDFKGTAVAINEIQEQVNNNGVATLYKLHVYSYNNADVAIKTYLESAAPTANPNPKTEPVKYDIITASQYKGNVYETSYQKYMELSGNKSMYLLVNIDGVYYDFYTVSSRSNSITAVSSKGAAMTVEPIDSKLSYFSETPPLYNFDQITGASNNVFVTKQYNPTNFTISEDIEPSNGWFEEGGRTLLRLTAQPNPILNKPLNLGLGKTFTVELGFKTKNISDKDEPILTIGNLLLRPTQVCWWTSLMKKEDLLDPESTTFATFNARNSQFLENVDTHIIITLTENWKNSDAIYSPHDLFPSQLIKDAYNAYMSGNRPKKNLLRIFVNGVIDREYLISDDDSAAIYNSPLFVNPTTSDIDFYLFRVYNGMALDYEQIQKNYISFLPEKTQKLSFYDKNDILEGGVISYKKCRGKYNTLLLINPKGIRVPNFTWNIDDPSDLDSYERWGSTLFLDYADPVINQQYGGRISHGRIKGQGSSARRYLWWNLLFDLNKLKKPKIDPETGKEVLDEKGKVVKEKINSEFRAYSTLREDNTFDPDSAPLKKCYYMPPYDVQQDTDPMPHKKLVGKINFASSMQSHKQGACKLYDDAYKATFTKEALYSGGRKAVQEEAFLYFYWDTDLEDVSDIQPADIEDNFENIKFAGFQTFGPGKGDDACSGYDEDLTPGYLLLEGAENGDPSTNFRVPWQALQRGNDKPNGNNEYQLTSFPTVSKKLSLEKPWERLFVYDDSITYNSPEYPSWDIEFGVEEIDNAYNEFANDEVKESLKVFRTFYDLVYKYSYNFVLDELSTSPQETWNKQQRYVVTQGEFFLNGVEVTDHEAGDMYRYEEYSNKWVKAGLYYENKFESGDYYKNKEGATGDWQRLNIFELAAEFGETVANPDLARLAIKDGFKQKLEELDCMDLSDVAFHQAFIKFLSGTDNRAKNSYFQIIGPLYKEVEDGEGETTLELAEKWDRKIRLIGDDLDTIMVTDNNGLQSKPYNLLENSYDESMTKHWGDSNNQFFKMFDQCYEDNINLYLTKILGHCNIDKTNLLSPLSYLYKVFFSILETYPAVAYNHTSKLWYENAQEVLDSKVLDGYKNNDISEPVSLSHGSCLQCEAQFMKERYLFLSGYAQTLTKSNSSGTSMATTSGSGGTGGSMKIRMEFEPYQDIYPNYFANGQKYLNILQNVNDPYTTNYLIDDVEGYNTIKRRTQPGKLYAAYINDSAINQGLYFTDVIKSLNILGLQTSNLDLSGDRITSLYIDNEDMKKYPELFKDYPPMILSGGFATSSNLPVLLNLTLKNITMGDTLDCSRFNKLVNIDLTGSTTNYVVFPETGTLQVVTIPAIKTLKIYNNPGLVELNIADLENLEEVYIDCSKCGELDVTDFCEKLRDCGRLKSVELRNAKNLNISVDALYKLINCEHCLITGTINIITSKENTDLYDITFSMKLDLVNLFGDIDSDSNDVKFNYKPSTIINVSTVSEVYVFGTPGEYPGLFPLTVPAGNDVLIKDGKLDIVYTMEKYEGSYNGIASLSSDGVITLHKESDTVVTKVYAVVLTKTGPKKTIPEAIVRFSWKAPSLGEFAYADGSFSGAYDPNKTVVGLVYACDPADEVSGTVHILGKEYFGTPKYLGYTSDGIANDANSVESANMYRVGKYLTDKLGIIENTYSIVGTAQAPNYIKDGDKNSRVNITDYTDFTTNYFKGKADTAKYMVAANQVLQALLAKDGSTLINYIEQKEVELNGEKQILYMPKNKAAFEYLIGTYLPSLPSEDTFLTDTDIMSCILYPHFYSVYYYEPTVKTGETLDPQYAAGNWYAPSAAELARIVYYRGYSATGSNFVRDEENTALEAAISKEIVNGKTPQTTPIFSLAAKSMTIPSVWTALLSLSSSGEMRRVGVNVATTEYTTLTNNVFFNWLYNWSGTSFYGWYHGYNPKGNPGVDGNSYGAENYWRARKQVGLPLVQYKYQKPVTE